MQSEKTENNVNKDLSTSLSSRSNNSEFKPFAANKIKQFRELFNKIDDNTNTPNKIITPYEIPKTVKSINLNIPNEIKNIDNNTPKQLKKTGIESAVKSNFAVDSSLSTSLTSEPDKSFLDINSSYSSLDSINSSHFSDFSNTKAPIKESNIIKEIKSKYDEVDSQVDDILSKWRKQKQTVESKDSHLISNSNSDDSRKITELINQR